MKLSLSGLVGPSVALMSSRLEALVIDATEPQLRSLIEILTREEQYVSLDAALEARRNEGLFAKWSDAGRQM